MHFKIVFIQKSILFFFCFFNPYVGYGKQLRLLYGNLPGIGNFLKNDYELYFAQYVLRLEEDYLWIVFLKPEGGVYVIIWSFQLLRNRVKKSTFAMFNCCWTEVESGERKEWYFC